MYMLQQTTKTILFLSQLKAMLPVTQPLVQQGSYPLSRPIQTRPMYDSPSTTIKPYIGRQSWHTEIAIYNSRDAKAQKQSYLNEFINFHKTKL